MAREGAWRRCARYHVLMVSMVTSAENVRRAGRLLRAMAGKAGWTSGVKVDARATAKANVITATEAELDEIEAYLVGQGWVARSDSASGAGAVSYAVTRHGMPRAIASFASCSTPRSTHASWSARKTGASLSKLGDPSSIISAASRARSRARSGSPHRRSASAHNPSATGTTSSIFVAR